MSGADAWLRAGQVARAAGVSRQTLRCYERRGLIAEPDRSLGADRVYSNDAVTALRIIPVAQRLGFSREEIDHLIDMGRHRHGQRPGEGFTGRGDEETRRDRGSHRGPAGYP